MKLRKFLLTIICININLVFCSYGNAATMPTTSETKTIAILDLQDLGPSVELEPLRKALPCMLISDLMQYSGIRMVARERIEWMVREIDLGGSGLAAKDTGAKPGVALAANYLVQGTFSATTGNLRIHVQIYDVLQNKAVQSFEYTGSAEELFAIEAQLLNDVVVTLDLQKNNLQARPDQDSDHKITLAIPRLQNLGIDAKWDARQTELTDQLAIQLQNQPRLAMVEREKLDRVFTELGLQQSGLTANGITAQIGQLLGAQVILLGSFINIKDTMRIDAHLVASDTGAIVAATSVQGETNDPSPAISKLAKQIAAELTTHTLPTPIAAASGTKSLEAVLHYKRGNELQQQGKYKEAIIEFERANFINQNDPLILTAWDLVYKPLGLKTDARIRVKEKLVSLGGEYYRDNINCMAHCYAMTGNFEKAITTYQQALELARNNPKEPWYWEVILTEELAHTYQQLYLSEYEPRRDNASRKQMPMAPPSDRETEAYAKTKYWYLLAIEKQRKVDARVILRLSLIQFLRDTDPKLRTQQLECLLSELPKIDSGRFRYGEFIQAISYYIDLRSVNSTNYEHYKKILNKIIAEYADSKEAAFTQLSLLASAAEKAGKYREAVDIIMSAIEKWWPSYSYAVCSMEQAAGLYENKLGEPERAKEIYQQMLWRFGYRSPLKAATNDNWELPYPVGQSKPIMYPGCPPEDGFSTTLRAEMHKAGKMVHSINIDSSITPPAMTRALMAGYGVFIIPTVGPQDLEQLSALRSYVATGGSLLLMQESRTTGWCKNTELLMAFGLPSQESAMPIVLSMPEPAVLTSQQHIFPPDEVPYLQYGTFLTAPPESVVATFQGKPIIASFKYGLGRILLCGLEIPLMVGDPKQEQAQSYRSTWAFMRKALTWLDTPDAETSNNILYGAIQKLAVNDISGTVGALESIVTRNAGTRLGEEAQILLADLLRLRKDNLAASAEYLKLTKSAQEPQIKLFARLQLARMQAGNGSASAAKTAELCWDVWRDYPANPWAARALLYAAEWLYAAGNYAESQRAADVVMNNCTDRSAKIEGMFWAAVCREKQGDTAGAVRIYRAIEPGNEIIAVNNLFDPNYPQIFPFVAARLRVLVPTDD
jgi:TolB-like protein/tetratricopeptide (TPR) repeat protein